MRRVSGHGITVAVTQVFICLLFLTACSGTPDGRFHPQDISCTDISTPEDKSAAENLLEKNWYGGILRERLQKNGTLRQADWDEYFNPILIADKRLAAKGNPWGVWLWGFMEHKKLIAYYLIDKGWINLPTKDLPSETLPESMKPNMIEALSYIYISATVDEGDKGAIQSMIDDIEGRDEGPKLHTPLITPYAWIQEAKANAQQWENICRP